jgi:hypothetical protein
VQELQNAFEAFRSALEAVPEDRVEPGRTVDRLVHSSGIDHYREHAAEIRAWRGGKRD